MDGLPGLIIAFTTAFGVLAKYAKLWEEKLPEDGVKSGKAGTNTPPAS
jgi:hypothetical protein